MKKRDYGKEFESYTESELKKEKACWDRFPDQMSGNSGSSNPCDYIAYKSRYLYYIECKSCQAEVFDIKGYISENQWVSLLKKAKYGPSVHAGYLVWFVEEKKVFWIPAPRLEYFYKNIKKSFRSTDLEGYGCELPCRQDESKHVQMPHLLVEIRKGCKLLNKQIHL